MKRILIIGCVAVSLMACVKDAPVDKPVADSNDLTVVAQVKDGFTRTSHGVSEDGLLLSWKENDMIGMYVTAGGEAYASNVAYKADKSAVETSFTALADEVEWKDGDTKHSFYAYYPQSDGAADGYSKVPVTVPSVQTQSKAGSTEHLAALDFMCAAKENVGRTVDGSVELAFYHPLSVLELTLCASDDSDKPVSASRIIFRCKDSKETVSAEGAKIDLSTGKIDFTGAETSNQIALDLTEPLELTAQSEDRVYMQITPGHGGKKFDVIAVVDGKEQVLATKTIPEAGIPAGVMAELSLSVKGETEGPGPIEGAVDLSDEATANTYVVNKAATTYKFKATVKGNGIPRTFEWNSGDRNDVNVNVSYDASELTIAPVSARLVWYNTPQSIEGWVRESPVEIESVKLADDGYVYFETPETFVDGNVLIAVYDAGGEILWSWNIWAVEGFDPDATAKAAGPYMIMDRNLGAMAGLESKNETDPIKAAWAVGHYYQWGRKDPMPALAQFSSKGALAGDMKWGLPTYTPIDELMQDCSRYTWGAENMMFGNNQSKNEYALGKALGSSFSIEDAVAESVKYPYRWITNGTGSGCTNPYMWVNSQANMSDEQSAKWRYLWGNMHGVDGVKTIYDPCPVGWKVPDAVSLGLVLGDAYMTDNQYGLYSSQYDLYFPLAGQRLAGFADYSNILAAGEEMFMMTSSVGERSQPYRGVRNKSHVQGAALDRYGNAAITHFNSYVGAGYQLRCVKEEQSAVKTEKSLTGPRAGFLGNSITEVWEARTNNPNFFKGNDFVHNGHSGTTTSNFIQRYNHMNVLGCQVLVVSGGINDFAENSGYYIPLEDAYNNLRIIARTAEAAGMKVIIGSTVPGNSIWWQNDAWNAAHNDIGQRVVELNKKLKALTEQRGYLYCDYHSQLRDEQEGLKLEYSYTASDRIHPNGAGYAVMESVVKPLIDEALKDPNLMGGGGKLEDLEKVEL